MWTMGAWGRLDHSGLPGLAGGLKNGDGVLVPKRQADVVQALHQAPSAVLIKGEGPAQVRALYLPFDEIDGELEARLLLKQGPQFADQLLLQHHRQQATLKGVVA